MEHLFAYLGSRSGGLTKALSTNDELFLPQALDSSVPYSPATLLDEGEWFSVDGFTNRGFKNTFIETNSPINTTDYNQIPVNDYQRIKYLCCESGGLKYFQKFVSSQLIMKRWFTVSHAPVLEDNKNIILFTGVPDVAYASNVDTLYFKDISKAKYIVKGVEELYREATEQEVKSFLQQDFISLNDGFSSTSVKVQNRKRIAIAMDRMKDLSASQRREISDYIQDYCVNVPYNNGKFSISSEEDLKFVLYGIDERYYTTRFSNEKRLANSVVAI